MQRFLFNTYAQKHRQINYCLINYSAPVGERSITISLSLCVSVCLYVCVSVYPRAYLWNHWTDRHEILCADPLWSWLGPPLAALR